MTRSLDSTLELPVAESENPPPFARWGVLSIAAAAGIVLLFCARRYNYFGDELYFLAAGRRLSFSYADQGPALPLLARMMDTLDPGSFLVLRLPSILLTLLALILSAMIAREMGGGRGAQLLTAITYGTSVFLLLQGQTLSTNTVDTALWVMITWLVVRWVRTRHDSLLIWASVVTALDVQVKWLIPFFWLAVAVSVTVFGPRALLRRRALWIGAGIVGVTSLPSLIWQAQHGWPQLAMTGVIRNEQWANGGAWAFLPMALLLAGVLGAILLISGIIRLFRSESLRPYRFFGLVLPLLTFLFAVTGGRPYYAMGVYGVVIAAGAVELTRRARKWMKVAAVPTIALSVAVILAAMPWKSPDQIDPPKDDGTAWSQLTTYGEFGWPELTTATADAYRRLSPAEQRNAVIMTDAYWQASALDQFGGPYHLPAVYSPNRGFGYFGTPPDSATTILYVGGNERDLRSEFATVDRVGTVNARLGMPNIARHVTLWKCTGPTRPWSASWPSLRTLS